MKVGDIVDGTIRNVSDFATFLDIGVGHDAFLHCSKYAGKVQEMRVNKRIRLKISDVKFIDSKGFGKKGKNDKKWRIGVVLV